MHSQLAPIAAQQRIVDLHRAADLNRLVHDATNTNCGNAVPAPRRAAAAPVPFLRWLRRRLA
ncbi:MAG: hypothetical protein WAN22_15605 [Solirubrobacteraceae bacterium]